MPKPAERCPQCRRKIKRSSDQNRRYWALIHLLAEKLRPNGQQFSAESFHLWAKSKYLGCTEHKLPNGKTLLVPNSTAELDVAEFSEYLDRVEAFAAERDVYLEDMESVA